VFTLDPRDALVLAHERAHRLREEAAADRLRSTCPTRRTLAPSLRIALAAYMRRAADRIYPAPLTRRPA
jgi:hypothetical protein